ncbi:MAG: cadherin repeat domain-containing protein [Candidatus Thorarchaeota archaeon]|jgi:hypothetical protein
MDMGELPVKAQKGHLGFDEITRRRSGMIRLTLLSFFIVLFFVPIVFNSNSVEDILSAIVFDGSDEQVEATPFIPSAIRQNIFLQGSYSYGSWSWVNQDPHEHLQDHGNEFSMGQNQYSPFLCAEIVDELYTGWFYSDAVSYSGPPLDSVTTEINPRTLWSQNMGDDGNCYYELDLRVQKYTGSSWINKGTWNNAWTYTGKTTLPSVLSKSDWGSGVVDGPGSYRLAIYMVVDPPSSGCTDSYWLYIEDFALYGEDTEPPIWVQTPLDQASEFGSSFSYDLDATDSAGIQSWWINNTSQFSIDSSGVITNRISVDVGYYGIEVRVYDTQNNYQTAIFQVTVRDTTSPTWTPALSDQIIEFGQPFNYDVSASDLSGIASYLISPISFFSIDISGEITNKTNLTVGVYGLTISAFDPYNNFVSTPITITVQDTTNPIWDQLPSNQEVIHRQPFRYNVNSSDLSGIDHYWVNDTTGFFVDDNGVISNNSMLLVKVYNLEVRAYDPFGNNVSVIFSVTVIGADPVWDEIPTNKIVEFGSHFLYNLNASAYFGIDDYWVNDTTYFSIDSTGLLTNLSLVPVGVYRLEVRAYDPDSRYCSAILSLTFEDTTSPEWIEFPPDLVIEYGSILNFKLNATDLSGLDRWWINNTLHFSIDSSGLLTNVGFSIGQFGIQVWVNDTHGNVNTGSFSILVRDTTPPIWTEMPSDQTVFEDEPLDYQLSATDLSGVDDYAINDTIHFSITRSGRITSIGLPAVGNYGISVVVYDIYGNSINAEFTVTILSIVTEPTTSPTTPPDLLSGIILVFAGGAIVIVVIVVVNILMKRRSD